MTATLITACVAFATVRPASSQLPVIAPDSVAVADVMDSVARTARPKADSGYVWPAPPVPRAGAILPAERVVAFYGNPRSTRMGILGALPPKQMLAKLDSTALAWAKADTLRGVKPALHLIATVAQASPGRDGKWRLRMPDAVIDTVYGWAKARGWLLFIDIQTGRSTVQAELPRFRKWLVDPTVHLALDPEFAMPGEQIPGKRIGTMDAAEVNHAIDVLVQLVDSLKLPPKMLVVHRFTDRMLTNAAKIKRDPRVQVIVDMDGFGSPSLKHSTWRRVIMREPVQYTGLKLFYKNDKPLLTPEEALRRFKPAPLYIQYQ